MARIAIIKIFNGLNLAPAQLAGQLVAAGHEVKVIYFKQAVSLPYEDADDYLELDLPGAGFASNGKTISASMYLPINRTEKKNLVKELKSFKPDLIGLTVFSGLINFSAEVTAILRKSFKCPIIWGGPGPTLEPQKCIDSADVLCINEGEEVFVELADRIQARQDYTDIKGTWVKTKKQVFKNENRPLMELDDLATPIWSPEIYTYINNKRVVRNYYPEPNKSYSIMTQRGCPFSCHFCIESKYQDMFGRKNSLRRKSVDSIIEELKWAKDNLPVDNVMFYDDVFTVHPRWLDEFLPRYKEEVGLPFWCYTYPTTHTRELLDRLKDAGCAAITMGVQSGSERVLKEHFNRPTKTSRVMEAAHEIVDAGITGFFDLISKVDFETVDDLEETFQFLLDFPVEMNSFGLATMTNYPTYRYTEDVIAADSAGTLNKPTDEEYNYYHHLYLLTRSTQPVAKIKEIRDDPKYRESPDLMREFYDFPLIMNFMDDVPLRVRQAS